jgi:hypothetical protein
MTEASSVENTLAPGPKPTLCGFSMSFVSGGSDGKWFELVRLIRHDEANTDRQNKQPLVQPSRGQ